MIGGCTQGKATANRRKQAKEMAADGARGVKWQSVSSLLAPRHSAAPTLHLGAAPCIVIELVYTKEKKFYRHNKHEHKYYSTCSTYIKNKSSIEV